jgi:hypothetical protein
VDFHPRYGFTFPQSLNGTFICKSEDTEHQETLRVKALQSPKASYSRSTEFVSTIVSVECESKEEIQAHQGHRRHSHITFNMTDITKKETKLNSVGKWISSYELVAEVPVYVRLTCVDESLTPIWTKELDFVRK